MILKEAVNIGLIGTILGITTGIGLRNFCWVGNAVYQRSLFVLSVQDLTIEMAPY